MCVVTAIIAHDGIGEICSIDTLIDGKCTHLLSVHIFF